MKKKAATIQENNVQLDTNQPSGTGSFVMTGSLEKMLKYGLGRLVNWSRRNSLWTYHYGNTSAFSEYQASFSAVHDIERFGVKDIRDSAEHADVLVVSGVCTSKMLPILLHVYEQMLEPKWVISYGGLANSGNLIYDTYATQCDVSDVLPVDVFVPGNPPRPEALIQAVMLLQESVSKEMRPLGVHLYDDDISKVVKPVIMSERDRKNPDRMAVKNLRQ